MFDPAAIAAACVAILWSISDFYDDGIFAGIVKGLAESHASRAKLDNTRIL